MPWQLLIPVKQLSAAKSRLDLPAELRRELMLAMALDVIAAAGELPDVHVTVISSDPLALLLGVDIVPDPGGGLSLAVAEVSRTLAGPVGVLFGDLPAASGEELRLLLDRAAEVERGLLADAQGRGTTVLTARVGAMLRPSYGEGSRQRHRDLGATDLTGLLEAPGLRQDVDTLADLHAAVELGAGPATRRVVASAGIAGVHLLRP